jgi:hypothetical protein
MVPSLSDTPYLDSQRDWPTSSMLSVDSGEWWAAAFDNTGVRPSVGVPLAEVGSIVSPTVGPTPILLDTFTAADGTDPTSRDMDTHPGLAGTSRWRWEGEELADVYENDFVTPTGEQYYYMLPGKVQSNALTPTQTVTLTTGMFAPSTTPPQGVSLKLRTDTTSTLFNTDNLFLFIEGNEGTSTLPAIDLSGIRIIDLIVRDAPYDNYLQLEVQIGGYLRALFSDAGSYQTADAVITGQKKFGLYVSSSQLALVVNGAVAASVSTGLVAAVPWSNVELMMRNPVVSNYTPEYRDAKIDSFAVYSDITLSEAIALTA